MRERIFGSRIGTFFRTRRCLAYFTGGYSPIGSQEAKIVSGMEDRTGGKRGKRAAMGSNTQIAERLRSFYLSVEEQTVPQRFLELLEQLDAVEQASRSSSARIGE
ncbi:NepR family anti-sigma factor [Rhizobium alarense]|uniref:NepR family anti-sigma factor n=1 Tax=Rhizobium alarense TaxID=2846851 RepID=UPI002E302995|nr:NepR family anti-sigma factor [Rhizobium alarense]